MGTEGNAVERLGDGVVQFACQALALLQGGQFLCLFIEPRVLNGNGCLVGNGQGECGMVRRKGLFFA